MSTRLKARPVTQLKQAPATTGSSEQFKRAVKLHQQGDLFMAETLYESLLQTEPHNLQVVYLLGLIGSQTQRPELARANVEKYLRTYPEDAQAIAILALAYYDLKDYSRAQIYLEKSIANRGNSPHIHYNLGKTYFALQAFSKAVKSYDETIRLQPDNIDAYIGKAIAHKELREFETAACTLEHAIMLDPYHPESHFFYGNVMQSMGDMSAAIESYETATAIRPDYVDALINCGTCYKDIDRLEEAFSCYNKALALNPDHPEGNYNKALTLLLDRQFASGWALHEWRMHPSDLLIKYIRPQIIEKAPEWDGRPLEGHLLVLAEQGLGDQIFFSSLLRDLQSDVREITVCIDSRVIPLLSRSYPGIHFSTHDEIEKSDNFDAQIYIGSLGRIYRSNEYSFKNVISSYLIADKHKTTKLRGDLKKQGRLLCGISWKSKNAEHGENKSLSLEQLSQALCLPDIDFIDLQYGDTSAERSALEANWGVAVKKLDEIDNLNDIDGLAALINACDIVVTVSNTTAHLAAALGKPTLVLLPQASAVFWYWHRESECSPWYPTARLFRKDELGDWPGVIDALTLTLAGIA